MNPPLQPGLLPTLLRVSASALRSTLVISLVALAAFAVREQMFELPALLRVAREHQSLPLLVFFAVWIWRFRRERQRDLASAESASVPRRP